MLEQGAQLGEFRLIILIRGDPHLVGGLEHQFYFPRNIGNVIIPIDFHIFQRGGPTTNQSSLAAHSTAILAYPEVSLRGIRDQPRSASHGYSNIRMIQSMAVRAKKKSNEPRSSKAYHNTASFSLSEIVSLGI